MAAYSFKLPDIGEGIAQAEIVAWHVAIGDMVDEDAPLADMMTDKATVEISAPVSGKIVSLAGDVGDQIAIGATLATLEIESGSDAAIAQEPVASPMTAMPLDTEEAPSPDAMASNDAHAAAIAPHTAVVIETNNSQPLDRRNPVLASPAVRRRAKDLGIDLLQLETATGGRIRHSDLDAFLAYNSAYRPVSSPRQDEQIRVVGLRRRIAKNMTDSMKNIPHFTYVEEIDVTKLEAMREDLNAHRADRPRLTLLPLLITAVCRAVADFPMINARYDDEAGVVTRSGAVHMGIATQTEGGLMVPVIRNAQDRNIWQLAMEIRRLADAARSGKATPSELSGSTLTITSLGALGGIATTPVINRPEVAIIGPNRIMERPVFRDGKVEAAKLMNMSISCDHRVVDGWDAASFVQCLKSMLETPAILFAP